MNNVNNSPQNKNSNLHDKISKLILFGVIYTFLFIFFVSTIKYTLPFVLAGIFALILRKPTKFLIKQLKIKAWLASLIMNFIFFSLIIILVILITTSLTNELTSLTKKLQLFLSDNSSNYFNNITIIFENFLDNIVLFDKYLLDTIITSVTNSFDKFLAFSLDNISALLTSIFLIFSYIPYVTMSITFTILSTYFFTKNFAMSNTNTFNHLITKKYNKIIFAIKHIKDALCNYIFTYIFLIFISMLITYVGFLILRINYALLLSILSAFLDLLPIVGMICVYLPLIIYFLLKGDILISIGLILLYILVFFSRQILEPKLMSYSLGVSPIATLISMFIGLQLWGLIGVIYCMFLVIFYSLFKKMNIL